MRVYYIGKFLYDWSTETYVTHALEQNGVEVVKKVIVSTDKVRTYALEIKRNQCDIVLFSKVTSRTFPELIEWCKGRGIVTVAWIWDLYWGYRKERPFQFLADILFTTDGGHVEEWQEYGANHITLRQGIHEPEHVMCPLDIRHDLAFIGTVNSSKQRSILTHWLNSNYGKRVVWHTRTRGLDLNQALSQVKIVVGASHPSPSYWSNRIYEILGRGGFMLFPETPGLDEEFTDGVHYVSYPRNDYKRLRWLIDYYLEHNEERERIRRAGFERCGEFTYTARVRQMLQKIADYQEAMKPYPVATK
jgi:hypothetical protein